MKNTSKTLLFIIALFIGTASFAQDKQFKDGSAWHVSFIKTTSGMGVDYLNNLKGTWKAMHDEAMKQGLIVSYKILDGMSATPEDWDIMLLVEYKNLASMEGNEDKWDAISKKVVGDDSAMKKLRESRVSQRTIYGEKILREVVYK
jgi:hypothetical protein